MSLLVGGIFVPWICALCVAVFPLLTLPVTYSVAAKADPDKLKWPYISISRSIDEFPSSAFGVFGLSFAMYLFGTFAMLRSREVLFCRRECGRDEGMFVNDLSLWFAWSAVAGGVGVLSVPETKSRAIHGLFALLFFGSMCTYMFLQLRIDKRLGIFAQAHPICHRIRVFAAVFPVVAIVLALITAIVLTAMHDTDSHHARRIAVGVGCILEVVLFGGFGVFFLTFAYAWRVSALRVVLDVQPSRNVSDTIQSLLHAEPYFSFQQ